MIIPKVINEVVCFGCRHLIKYPKCKAFEIIPQIIREGSDDHTKPLPQQDNDIVFEEIDHEGNDAF